MLNGSVIFEFTKKYLALVMKPYFTSVIVYATSIIKFKLKIWARVPIDLILFLRPFFLNVSIAHSVSLVYSKLPLLDRWHLLEKLRNWKRIVFYNHEKNLLIFFLNGEIILSVLIINNKRKVLGQIFANQNLFHLISIREP